MLLTFNCKDCKKRQRLDVGQVMILEGVEGLNLSKYSFENEVKCKACGGRNLGLEDLGHLIITGGLLRGDAWRVKQEVTVEGKSMHFSKVADYLKRRIREAPGDGILRLRYANALRRYNRQGEAIPEYEEAIRLNPKLLGSYINLCEIYLHRSIQYKEKGAKTKAKEYFRICAGVLGAGHADYATIPPNHLVSEWINEYKDGL